jgi:4-aminobutyrate aminotransferase-like enzyme
MMLGVELVEDRETKAPAPAAAAYVLERARQLGVHIQVEAIGRTPFYVRTS